MKKRTYVFLIPAFLLSLSNAKAADLNEIIGKPEVRVVSNQQETFRVELAEKDQSEYALVIKKEADGYVWTSREGKVLKYSISGAFDYFINEEGSGYIKIIRDASVMNPLKGLTASVQENQSGCKYIESMSDKLNTITYFGNCEVH